MGPRIGNIPGVLQGITSKPRPRLTEGQIRKQEGLSAMITRNAPPNRLGDMVRNRAKFDPKPFRELNKEDAQKRAKLKPKAPGKSFNSTSGTRSPAPGPLGGSRSILG